MDATGEAEAERGRAQDRERAALKKAAQDREQAQMVADGRALDVREAFLRCFDPEVRADAGE